MGQAEIEGNFIINFMGPERLCVFCSLDLEKVAGKADRRRAALYRELSQRSERQEKLSGLAAKLAFDKELMGKGTKRKQRSATATSPAAFKWKQERKK